MRTTRIYQPGNLSIGAKILLDEAGWRHTCQVLRLKVGAEFIIFNGDGYDYAVELVNIGKHQAEVAITDRVKVNKESPLFIHVGQCISRGDRMDFAIQKAVELGVNKITPLISEFSDHTLNAAHLAKRQQHWQQVAISACEQSGRAVLPLVDPAVNIVTWMEKIDSLMHKFILNPYAEPEDLPSQLNIPQVALLIGPEGGISERELAAAHQQGFKPLLLGPRILRTETATVAAVSVVQWLWGDGCA